MENVWITAQVLGTVIILCIIVASLRQDRAERVLRLIRIVVLGVTIAILWVLGVM